MQFKLYFHVHEARINNYSQRECNVEQQVLINRTMTCTCVLHFGTSTRQHWRQINKFKVLWRTQTRLCIFLSLSKYYLSTVVMASQKLRREKLKYKMVAIGDFLYHHFLGSLTSQGSKFGLVCSIEDCFNF